MPRRRLSIASVNRRVTNLEMQVAMMQLNQRQIVILQLRMPERHLGTMNESCRVATMSHSCGSPSGHLKRKLSLNARMPEGIALHSNIYSHHRKVR